MVAGLSDFFPVGVYLMNVPWPSVDVLVQVPLPTTPDAPYFTIPRARPHTSFPWGFPVVPDERL
jgi:hypothetical protein